MHVCGNVWVHVCGFRVHVYGAVGCMYAVDGSMYMETFGCMYADVGCKSMERLGAKYAAVGCMYMESFGCKYAVVVCKSMERLSACLTVSSYILHVYPVAWAQGPWGPLGLNNQTI